jgi:hypothetical protein
MKTIVQGRQCEAKECPLGPEGVPISGYPGNSLVTVSNL